MAVRSVDDSGNQRTRKISRELMVISSLTGFSFSIRPALRKKCEDLPFSFRRSQRPLPVPRRPAMESSILPL